jgi:hypothetical protein
MTVPKARASERKKQKSKKAALVAFGAQAA